MSPLSQFTRRFPRIVTRTATRTATRTTMLRSPQSRAFGTRLLSALLLSLSFGAPAFAGDPFRSTNPQPIGPRTEGAFLAAFRDGNYREAENQLQQALKSETQEPLAYSLMAALAFRKNDFRSLKTYTEQVRTAATQIRRTQPLRSHLYTGMAHFFDGVQLLMPNGDGKVEFSGMSPALGKLKDVYTSLDQARRIDPKDPELNLVQGFMDVMISTYLPLASTDDAIKRLQQDARPTYLVDYGSALAQRNLKRYDQALTSLNKALAVSPNQPEFHYLKAQILVSQGREKKNDKNLLQQAQTSFAIALNQADKLPKRLVADIFFEACRNQGRLIGQKQNCDGPRDQIRAAQGDWGDPKLAVIPGMTPTVLPSSVPTNPAIVAPTGSSLKSNSSRLNARPAVSTRPLSRPTDPVTARPN